MLFKYRYTPNREFYSIELKDFLSIIKSIETLNKLYNTEELLKEFIYNYDNTYYSQRFGKESIIEKENKK